IVLESKRIPEKIWVDQGSEFYNKDFKKWAKQNNITIYSTFGESKSVVVERFIRTIKENIAQYFTGENSRNWVKVLPELVQIYNKHEHRTIKMTPTEASKPENEFAVLNALTKNQENKTNKPKFKVGDEVRISRQKDMFEKGYAPNFSREVFKVSEVLQTVPVTYKIVDWEDDPITGSFYEQELLKTKVPDYYDIEKILKTKTKGKHKEFLVRFAGWPKKFDMWLPEDQLGEVS